MLIFPRLESTNALALSLASDLAHRGVALLAEEQTAGRGQYGRQWLAPPRSSVLLSVLLHVPAELRRPALMVAWAAVSVCELVHAVTGLDARIKWPNDVLVHGKKVCGILIEQRNTGHADFPLATVVGVGLNVAQPAETFAAAGLPDAASLFSLSGTRHDTEAIAHHLLGILDHEYGRLLAGDGATLEVRWQQRLGLLDRRVRVEGIDRHLNGRLHELTLDGLHLELDHGEHVWLESESVRHVHAIDAGALSGGS